MTIPPSLLPVRTGTRVILDPGDKPVYSIVQETDARTAIARGLKEYIEQLEWNAYGGRLLRFKHVYDTWPQSEEKAEYPSAAVAAVGKGNYDASRLTPGAYESTVEGKALIKTSEMTIDVQLGIWATDTKERMWLVAMLEDKLSPTDFMYGLRLELPHYFGARATYEPFDMAYDDSPENAMKRSRLATITLHGAMSVLRLAQLPGMRPMPGTQIVEQDSDFEVPGDGVTQVFRGQTG
jgi:hypothetical protein